MKVASTAVVSHMLGLTRGEAINVVSLAWVDGQSLRTYRHAPNTGSRKSWAAGDATSRAVRLALIAKTGEMGYPSVLTAKTWGFYDASFRGKPLLFQRPYGSYVMENILFKISYPAEFHSQTAIEAAMLILTKMKAAGRTSDNIESNTVRTHEACIRIIDKKGPLDNPADRDHCIQYMVAVPLIFGRLTAEDYEDATASDPRIDSLRVKIACVEEPGFTEDYHDPHKRSIANSLLVRFTDGAVFEETVEYPIGHKRRRADGIPLLKAKFERNLARGFGAEQQQAILAKSSSQQELESTAVNEIRRPLHSHDTLSLQIPASAKSTEVYCWPCRKDGHMRILSLVRQVPDAEENIKIRSNQVDLSATKLVVDTMDEYGVEEALRLRESGSAIEVIVVSIGTAGAEEALRTALAIGADRAILVESPEQLDVIATSAVIAEIAKREFAELIFCGRQQADWDSQGLGPALAERLDWPLAAWTTSLALSEGTLTGTHDVDEGSEAYVVSLPAVITTQQGLNEPRYPTLPNIMRAKKKELRHETLNGMSVVAKIKILSSEV